MIEGYHTGSALGPDRTGKGQDMSVKRERRIVRVNLTNVGRVSAVQTAAGAYVTLKEETKDMAKRFSVANSVLKDSVGNVDRAGDYVLAIVSAGCTEIRVNLDPFALPIGSTCPECGFSKEVSTKRIVKEVTL